MSGFYNSGLDAFAKGDIIWKATGGSAIKCVLVDLNDYALAVTGATNATPIVITTSVAHGLATGALVSISGVGGNTAANGKWTITNVTATTFSLDTSVGNGVYTSGGFTVKLSVDDNLDDIPVAAREETSGNLVLIDAASGGVLDANDITFTAATGDVSEALVLYKDTGTASTSTLILIVDSATGLPITLNGGNVNVTWDNGANKIAKI